MAILQAKFKEICLIIWIIHINMVHFRIVLLEVLLICALKTFGSFEDQMPPFLFNSIRVSHCCFCRYCRNKNVFIVVLSQQNFIRQKHHVYFSPYGDSDRFGNNQTQCEDRCYNVECEKCSRSGIQIMCIKSKIVLHQNYFSFTNMHFDGL